MRERKCTPEGMNRKGKGRKRGAQGPGADLGERDGRERKNQRGRQRGSKRETE